MDAKREEVDGIYSNAFSPFSQNSLGCRYGFFNKHGRNAPLPMPAGAHGLWSLPICYVQGDDVEHKAAVVHLQVHVGSEEYIHIRDDVEYKAAVVHLQVHVGSEEYIHIRVFKPLPCNAGNPELHSFHDGKTKTDSLEYF